jgi:hypothetical protein
MVVPVHASPLVNVVGCMSRVPRQEIGSGITKQTIVSMGLITWRFIEVGIQCAIVAFAEEFNNVGWIKDRVILARHVDGLFDPAVEEVEAAGIDGPYGDSGCLQICVGQAVDSFMSNPDFIVGLPVVDPAVGRLGIGCKTCC